MVRPLSSRNNWSETTITWNNRPGRSNSLIADRGATASNSWVKYNVTTAVTGNGTYTFVLATNVTDGITFNSREASSNQPRLVINADTSSTTLPANSSAEFDRKCTGVKSSRFGVDRVDG